MFIFSQGFSLLLEKPTETVVIKIPCPMDFGQGIFLLGKFEKWVFSNYFFFYYE